MPKRSSKPRDLNAMASAIVEEATSDEPTPDPDEGKNPHAVALGRMGGKRGGKARAESLSPEQRSEIAKRAAHARWAKGRP
jgi:hypothetical protein